MKPGSTFYVGANGRPLDLLAPMASDIDFKVIAEQLGKMARYNGGTPGSVFSVAQHSSVGADAIFAETGDAVVAAYFALHDGHEAFLGDDTTPKKRALEAIAFTHFGTLADAVLGAFGELANRFDVAIHAAAGLPWPPPAIIVDQVKTMDRRMLLTEWRDLMNGAPLEHRKDDPEPLFAILRPVKWWVAAEVLEARFRAWLPALNGGARGEA